MSKALSYVSTHSGINGTDMKTAAGLCERVTIQEDVLKTAFCRTQEQENVKTMYAFVYC